MAVGRPSVGESMLLLRGDKGLPGTAVLGSTRPQSMMDRRTTNVCVLMFVDAFLHRSQIISHTKPPNLRDGPVVDNLTHFHGGNLRDPRDG